MGGEPEAQQREAACQRTELGFETCWQEIFCNYVKSVYLYIRFLVCAFLCIHWLSVPIPPSYPSSVMLGLGVCKLHCLDFLVEYLDVFVWQQWTVMALSPANFAAATAAKLLQLYPTLCDPRKGSPPGSAAPGILQARTLDWVAISFSNAWKWKVNVKSLSRVWLLATPWTAAYQALPSMGFSRQEYWSRLPLPSPATFSTSYIYHPWCSPNQRSKIQLQRSWYLSHAWHPPLTLSF